MEEQQKEKHLDLAAQVAGAAIQQGYGEELVIDDEIAKVRDSAASEAAKMALKKGLVGGDDAPTVTFAAIQEIAMLAASSAIQKGFGNENESSLTEEQKHKLRELSILAAGSAVQHHFGEESVEDFEIRDKMRELGQQVADLAISKKLVPDDRNDPTLKSIASIARQAASSAIQKLLAVEDRETSDEAHNKQRLEIAKLAAAAAAQKLNASSGVTEGHLAEARETAQFAIDHNLIVYHEPPNELVSQVARLAAAAAIQRGLEDEVVPEVTLTQRKDFLASVARDAASFAIRRGLGAEVRPNRKRAYELAVLAASSAVRRQEQRREEDQRVPPAQLAEVAVRAAQEAIRLGFGRDQADIAEMPQTPPAEDIKTAANLN